MDYEDFLRALAMLAADKQIMFEKLAWQVLDSVNSMMGYTFRWVVVCHLQRGPFWNPSHLRFACELGTRFQWRVR